MQIQHHPNQMMMLRQMGINGPIGPSSSLTGGPVPQSQLGPGPSPLINNSLMMQGAPGMHVRVLCPF